MKDFIIKVLVTLTITLMATASSAVECNIGTLSSKNFSKCMQSSGIEDRAMANKFCRCVERNMDWEFMLKENTYIDREKCEFTETQKLISEKEVLEKCPKF